MIQVSTEAVTETIRAEISRAANDTYKSLSEKIAADVCNQVRNKVTEHLRGQTLFEEPKNRPECPWKDQIKPLPGEYIIMQWKDGTTFSTYGRIVEKSCSSHKQFREPGAKLTNEIVDYVNTMVCDNTYNDSRRNLICAVINKYNEKYAFAHNSVHAAKVEAIRAEIKQELADEFAKLAEERQRLEDIASDNHISAQLNEKQAALLKTEREEFDREVAKEREYRKSEQELKTAKKQISLIKKQLAKEVARLDKEREALKQEREQLALQRQKLADREFLLGAGGIDVDTEGTSSESE